MDFFSKYWEIIIIVCGAIAGFTAWIRNILHVKNLSMQNRKLKKNDEEVEKSKIFNKRFNDLYIIDYSEKIRKQIEKNVIDINDIIAMLHREFDSHKIFGLIDYISIPIPLKSGLFVFLTKEGLKLTIEDLGNSLVVENWYEKWRNLSIEYHESYRLLFRRDHLSLFNLSEFNRTKIQINKLYDSLNEYYASIIPYIERDKAAIIHDLKFNIGKAIELAERYYEKFLTSEDSSALGQVAINYDIVISSIHKIIVDIKPSK